MPLTWIGRDFFFFRKHTQLVKYSKHNDIEGSSQVFSAMSKVILTSDTWILILKQLLYKSRNSSGPIQLDDLLIAAKTNSSVTSQINCPLCPLNCFLNWDQNNICSIANKHCTELVVSTNYTKPFASQSNCSPCRKKRDKQKVDCQTFKWI